MGTMGCGKICNVCLERKPRQTEKGRISVPESRKVKPLNWLSEN